MAERYLGFRVEAQHEPEFGGWTAWVDGGCVMRLLGGPKVRHSEKAALALCREHAREIARRQRG
jgi:hypothetical protein